MPPGRTWQTGVVSSAAVAALVLTLCAAGIAGFDAWARLGFSPAARFWMSDGAVENWRAERFVVLGAPAIAVVLLAAAVLAAPVDSAGVRVVAGGVLLLALVPLLWTVLAVIPVPGFLYPAWARRIRTTRRSRSRRLT